MRHPRERGVALIITVLALGMFSAIGMGLVLASSVDRLSGSNHRDGIAAAYAAEAAVQLTIKEMAAVADWSSAFDGSRASPFNDGPPGVRQVPFGPAINLAVLTNELTCGRATDCTDARIRSSTTERPWGANNPQWQVFLSSRASALVTLPPRNADVYLVVWVGDDAAERDDDRLRDGSGPDGEGRHVARIRAMAFGPAATRAAIDAVIARRCETIAGTESCEPGIRVQSWRRDTSGIP
jgi:hypothetical protein